jgi:hypothetical protein
MEDKKMRAPNKIDFDRFFNKDEDMKKMTSNIENIVDELFKGFKNKINNKLPKIEH